MCALVDELKKIRFLTPFFIASAVIMSATSHAADLSELLPELVQSHPLIRAAETDAEASSLTADEKRLQWAPDLSVTTSIGREDINKPNAADTDYTSKYLSIGLTQTLWDFGKINADISSSQALAMQKNIVAEANRQKVRLEGIKSYAEVVRWRDIVSFARQSVANIQRQADMESARVDIGRGLTTDILQAKTQLAGAEARLVQAKGQYEKSVNEFKRVFGDVAVAFDRFTPVVLAEDKMPLTSDDAVILALDNSFDIKIAQMTVDVLSSNVSAQYADSYMPELLAKVRAVHKNDYSGDSGSRQELIGKIELNWEMNLGLANDKTYKSTLKRASAGKLRLADTIRLVERKVNNSWLDYKRSLENVALLENQERLVTEYLRLARLERRAGRRSLLDVLSGESALYNARSDAASSRVDAVVAGYTLLLAIGALDETAYLVGDAGPKDQSAGVAALNNQAVPTTQ